MEIKIKLIRGALRKVPHVCVLLVPVSTAGVLAPTVALPVLETKQKPLSLGGTCLSGGLGIVASWPLPSPPPTKSKASPVQRVSLGTWGPATLSASQIADLSFPLGQSRSIVDNKQRHEDSAQDAVLPLTFLYVACGCIQMPNSD